MHEALKYFIRNNGYNDGKLTLVNVWKYKNNLVLSNHEKLELEEKHHIRFFTEWQKLSWWDDRQEPPKYCPMLQQDFYMEYMKVLNNFSKTKSETEMAEKADLEPAETKLSDEDMARFIMAEKAEMHGWTFRKTNITSSESRHAEECFEHLPWVHRNSGNLEELEAKLSDDKIGEAHQMAFVAIAAIDRWTMDCFDFLNLPQKQKFLGGDKWDFPCLSKMIEQEWGSFMFRHSMTAEECYSHNFPAFIHTMEKKLFQRGWDIDNEIVRCALKYRIISMLRDSKATEDCFGTIADKFSIEARAIE